MKNKLPIYNLAEEEKNNFEDWQIEILSMYNKKVEEMQKAK